MRILIVAGPLTGTGGIETCIRNLAIEAKTQGDECRTIAFSDSSVDRRWQAGLDYKAYSGLGQKLSAQAILGIACLWREMRRYRPDIVLTIYASLIFTARAAGALLRNPPLVCSWLHFSFSLRQRTGLLKLADRHLCINTDNLHYIQKYLGVRHAHRASLLFNSIPMQNIRATPRSPDSWLRLVYVGRLMVGGQKQTDILLRQLAKLTGLWKLEVVGSGPDEPSLRQLAISLGVSERITWHGWKSDPWSTIEAADITLLTSSFEGFGMVLVESIARGIACISSDCPSGPSDILQNGLNGWLYPHANPDSLATLLQEILDGERAVPAMDQVRRTAVGFDSKVQYMKLKNTLLPLSQDQ